MAEFEGFPRELPAFLADLAANNAKPWFDAHRDRYEADWLAPAKGFVAALAAPLAEIDPEVQVEPRVNGSIFRINRDVRFSKDKTPYKTTLDMMFWHGEASRTSPGFFMRIEADRFGIGAGMHGFTPQQLEKHRAAVLDDALGKKLEKAIAKTGEEAGGQHYKRVPRGLPADHPRANWLRHKALWTYAQRPLMDELFDARAVDTCADLMRRQHPVLAWLVEAFA